jgi:hypothetical protein
VANNWRQLNQEQKDIFNHQAAIEKKVYKLTLNTWVMKQMKQGCATRNSSPAAVQTTPQSPVEPIRIVSNENAGNIIDPIPTTITVEHLNNADNVDHHTQLLSTEEMNYLLGCFNILPSQTSQQSSMEFTTTNQNDLYSSNNSNNNNHDHHDPNDWIRLDDENIPLWYDEDQLKGCSEEFALQMIQNDQTNASGFDRAITL